MGEESEKFFNMLLFSVLVGSSLSLPALQRTQRQYYQQPGQYYQQTTYNQYPSNNQYNNQDWSSSSSSSYPNVQINGNFNNDICNSQDKFFGLDSLIDVGKNLLGGLFGGGGGLFGGRSGGGMGMNLNMQGGGNSFGNMAGNNNINTGHMDGGSQVQNTQGNNQMQNGLDLGAILQKLVGAFTQTKSFNGQMQYINKQTGQSATCEDLKSFLQQEINAQQSPYGNFQMHGNINTGTMNGGSQIYNQQQRWNGYPAYGQMQQRNYNYYG